MAKTLVDIYDGVANTFSQLRSGVITAPVARQRLNRLAATGVGLGTSLTVPTTAELRLLEPKHVTLVPATAIAPTVDTNDYESSEEEYGYEESYESSSC